MKHLFIEDFIAKDYSVLCSKLELIVAMWIIVLIAIILDLIAGLRKASLCGQLHTSYGFRRTVTKAVQYYGLMSFAFLFDALASVVAGHPYFSMLSSLFLVFIEAKSVFEKARIDDREKMNETLKEFLTIVEHRDDLAKGFIEILQHVEDDNKHKKDKKHEQHDESDHGQPA